MTETVTIILSTSDATRLRSVLADARVRVRDDAQRMAELHARNAYDILTEHLGVIADTIDQIDALLLLEDKAS